VGVKVLVREMSLVFVKVGVTVNVIVIVGVIVAEHTGVLVAEAVRVAVISGSNGIIFLLLQAEMSTAAITAANAAIPSTLFQPNFIPPDKYVYD
jgi:exosome complex RNA-binding protein Rrp4